MATPTKPRVSLEQFLAMEETKPYREYMDGEVIEKAMPNRPHGALVAELIIQLGIYLRLYDVAWLTTELRHLDTEGDWVFLPDVSVTLKSRQPAPPADTPGAIEVMPDFAIEVLSPDDRPGRTAQRIAYYMRAGVTLLWVIDPEDESVTVWERGAEPRAAHAPDMLEATAVLPGFAVDLEQLFATLHRA